MKFFLKKNFSEHYDDYFDGDKPFYVFGELAVRGGDYYYGDSHRLKCNTLAMHLFGDPTKRVLAMGRDFIGL